MKPHRHRPKEVWVKQRSVCAAGSRQPRRCSLSLRPGWQLRLFALGASASSRPPCDWQRLTLTSGREVAEDSGRRRPECDHMRCLVV